MSNGGGSRPINFKILEEETSKRRKNKAPETELTCEVQNCKGTPTKNKPYCLDHLDRDPKIKRLMSKKTNMQEIKKDILNCLAIHGWASYQLLYDNVDGDRNTVHAAVDSLLKAKKIQKKEEPNHRRGTIIEYFLPISA